MKSSRVARAARNNAIWCNTVCRAHGVAGEFFETVWLNRRASPPYYPNLVTLCDAADQTATLGHIRNLIGTLLARRWAIKDSFSTLDLTALNFDRLFDASWIWHEPVHSRLKAPSSTIRWTRVSSPGELSNWEAVWSRANGIAELPDEPHQFPQSLFADGSVVGLAGYQGQDIVAGGIANQAGDVVGLSNVFALSNDDEESAWAGLVASAQRTFPGMPLVGYEQGDHLEAARACGFEPIGALRVWLHRD